jgi:3-ketosteroid 9alpha-monooxygenase subunit A
VAEIIRQVEEDIPIWEHKLYRPKPLLSAGDKSIPALRHWSRQFLEG